MARQRAMENPVMREDVGVLHGEDVRRGSPLIHGKRQRRRVTGFAPGTRHSRLATQVLDVDRVHEHEHVQVRLSRDLLAPSRGAVQCHAAQHLTVCKRELPDEFFQGHCCHVLPAPARAAAAEPTATAEAAEPSTPTKAATTKASTPAPTATVAAIWR